MSAALTFAAEERLFAELRDLGRHDLSVLIGRVLRWHPGNEGILAEVLWELNGTALVALAEAFSEVLDELPVDGLRALAEALADLLADEAAAHAQLAADERLVAEAELARDEPPPNVVPFAPVIRA